MGSDKRRVPHDIAKLFLRHKACPIHPQRIPLHNVCIGLQRQKINIRVNDFLRLPNHLLLGDPKGCFGDSNGKVIDFYAVELANGYLDGIRAAEIEHDLTRNLVPVGGDALTEDFIFKPSKGKVSLREEIPGTAGRIQKCQRRELVLELLKPALSCTDNRYILDLRQLRPQVGKEKGIDDLVDVLD